jgi:pimeloyl-ACP methyl ester carboxylesterase
MEQAAAPSRPGEWQERFAVRLFRALSPRLKPTPQPEPPEELAPFEHVTVPRGQGQLSATLFPAAGEARGTVLLLHPWLSWGQTYFHRHGRIEALRSAGYHALTLDLGGFGSSRPSAEFLDRDVEAGLWFLRERFEDLPLHLWGVSAGGYWAHSVLARTRLVFGAMFEDVSPHLLEWSWRTAPLGRPFYLFYRQILRSAYRFLDARSHAHAMCVKAVAYVSGEKDRGVRPEDTRALAEAAGGPCRIVPGAGHLGAIKLAQEEIIELALDTFRKAEEDLGARLEFCWNPPRIGGDYASTSEDDGSRNRPHHHGVRFLGAAPGRRRHGPSTDSAAS